MLTISFAPTTYGPFRQGNVPLSEMLEKPKAVSTPPVTRDNVRERVRQMKQAIPWWSPAAFASATDATARTDANVTSLSALVFDVEGKGSPAAIDAFADLDLLDGLIWYAYTTISHNLPTKGPRYRLVLPFAAPVAVPDWRTTHHAWMSALESRGIPVDRTATNPSRIYFAPAYIEGQRPLYAFAVCEDGEHVEAETLDLEVPSPQPTHNVQPPPPPQPEREEEDELDAVLRRADAPRSDLQRVETRCAFMRHARDNAASLPNPEWYAWLGVLTRVVDGRDHAHAIGSSHPTYRKEDTDRQFDRQLRFGPSTCDHIATLHADCATCPFRTTTPVALGEPDPIDHALSVVDQSVDLDETAVRDAQARLLHAREEREALQRRLADATGALARAREQVVAARAAVRDSRRAVDGGHEARERLETATALHREAKAAHTKVRKAFDKLLARSVGGSGRWTLPDGFHDLLTFYDNGRPHADGRNIRTILLWSVETEQGDQPGSRLLDRVEYDAFTAMVLFDGEPLNEHTHIPELRYEIENSFDMNFLRNDTVYEEITSLAQSHRAYDSWMRFVNDLPAWDGVPRCHRVFPDMMNTADDEVHEMMSRWFMISLMVRGQSKDRRFNPLAVERLDNKVDTAPVFISTQGTGKSTAVEKLAMRPEWFLDTPVKIGDKDGMMKLRGRWLIELSELVSVTRKKDEEVKNFISRKDDTYREPYAKTPKAHPRRCVFVGTTNRTDALRDPTGIRRWWPVFVGSTDYDWYEANYTQCLAEAWERCRNGERHYPHTAREKQIVSQHQSMMQYEDPMVEQVRIAVLHMKVTRVKVPDLIRDHIRLGGTEREQQDAALHDKVARALERLGWRAIPTHRWWYHAPPGFLERNTIREAEERDLLDPKKKTPEEAATEAVQAFLEACQQPERFALSELYAFASEHYPDEPLRRNHLCRAVDQTQIYTRKKLRMDGKTVAGAVLHGASA